MTTQAQKKQIPVPPMRYRFLVGPLDPEHFDNPTGNLIDPNIPEANYEAVFDFGCGCGRLARQLLQQHIRPKRYIGVDINRRMIDWCQQNLAVVDPNFRFVHHDVFNPVLGQFNTQQTHAPFPVGDGEMSLLIALSVFTHLLPEQAEFYLRETSRILRPGGIAFTSWFFFDKRDFLMMQDFQNALFINLEDPSNAVIYDRGYFHTIAAANGFHVREIIDGYQTRTYLEKLEPAVRSEAMPDSISLARLKERPNVPRHQTDSDAEPDEAEVLAVPPVNSLSDPSKLSACLRTDDDPLVDDALSSGEIFPCAFDVENNGEAAWLCVGLPDEEARRTGASGSGGKIQMCLTWYRSSEDGNRPHARCFFDLIQFAPVLPGEVARAVFMPTAPTVSGEYRLTLRMARDEIEWPQNGDLYQQTIRVMRQDRMAIDLDSQVAPIMRSKTLRKLRSGLRNLFKF